MRIEQILEERGKTHGDFTLQAKATQEIKRAMAKAHSQRLIDHGPDATAAPLYLHYEKEALDMIAHKLGRIATGDPHEIDHWDDIAGYATLVANRLRERQQRMASPHTDHPDPEEPRTIRISKESHEYLKRGEGA